MEPKEKPLPRGVLRQMRKLAEEAEMDMAKQRKLLIRSKAPLIGGKKEIKFNGKRSLSR